ncbi:MAG TPA: hypothetical protein VFZ77_22980 [Acidimicrobiales bacterium]
MSTPHLEDRLRRLAGDLAAPPTGEARAAIARRAGRLRRRRAVAAAGTGVLAVALAAGLLAQPRGGPADVETEPAGRGDAGLPALTIDGWRVVAAEDGAADPAGAGPGAEAGEGSFQVFRVPGDLSGPSVFLRHEPASDAQGGPEAGEEAVTIGGREGYLQQTGPGGFALRWNPATGDSAARLQAWGLTRDEVLRVARGLRPHEASITFPPAAGTAFGFAAGDLPAGIEEVHPAAAPAAAGGRRVVLERGPARVEISVHRRSGLAFEASLGDLLMTADGVTQARVLEADAVLVELPDGDGTRWRLAWQDGDGVAVDVAITGVPAAGVDDVVAGLREVPPAEWQALVDGAP